MPLKRFGVSLEDNLLESLDQYVSENGFANRSQAIRFLVEKNVAEKKWQCNHIVAGTIILMYDQVKKDITSRIADIQQNYQDVILSSSQYYVNRNFCLHIATVMGTAYRLTELSDRLTTIKGLKHGKLVMSLSLIHISLAPMCRLKMYINCRRSNYREDCRNSKDDFHS